MADIMQSARAATREPSIDALAGALISVGWPSSSLERDTKRDGVVIAQLGGQPKILIVGGDAPQVHAGDAGAVMGPMSMGYSSEAPYTLIWTPERVQLHQTTYWTSLPGDSPLVQESSSNLAATANLLELLSPSSIVNDEPVSFRTGLGKQQPDLAQNLGQALARLRAAVVSERAIESDGSADDLRVMRLFHQLLFIRFIEDRHPDESLARVSTVLEASDLQESLARIVRHYSRTLRSELFTREALPIEVIPPAALRATIEALTEPWQRLHLDFQLTPNDVSGRLYESYLGKRPAIDHDEGTLFPVVNETDDRSQRASFYTPTAIAMELARATLEPWLEENAPESPSQVRVLDPACGSGAFLLASYRVLREYFGARKGSALSQGERRELLACSIFGADQDESALMLAQVALYEEADLGGDSSLPAMGSNLLLGDSLLSPPGAPLVGGVPWAEVIREGRFQVILANPPFGAQKTRASRSTAQYRQGVRAEFSQTHEWGADLAYYFVELSARLLDDGGMAGFVLPRKALTGLTGSAVRRLMTIRGLRTLQDYRGARLFPSVSAYVALVTFGGQPKPIVHVEDVRDSRVDASLLLDPETRRQITRQSIVAREVLDNAPSWSAFELRWNSLQSHIGARWCELGAVEGITIASGIQSGANKRFVVEPERLNRRSAVVRGYRIPLDVLPKFVKGPDVLPFRVAADVERRIVVPFPANSVRGRALDGVIAALGGRPANTQLGKIDTWLGPKVLVRAFGLEPCAASDPVGDVVAPKGTAGAFAVAVGDPTIEKLLGMVAYFNSAFAQWWLRGAGEPRADETVEILEGHLRRLPWPDLDNVGWQSLARAADAVLLTLSLEGAVERAQAWWSARRAVDDLVFDILEISSDLRSIVVDEVVRRA
ncbi:class I SAM-dependent DNA methyltransferase [Oerskovia sp. NPDC057915]|uniref:HsdM family class I SAM-dependent methyltransferase n=1 Tax=Oerskovia sp. NPDC057915 TaxID=3346280 RepID=UPI0036D7A079